MNPMASSDPDRGKIVTALFWAAILLVPVSAILIGTGYISYWTIPPFRVLAEGDPLFAFDPEIGYVARPNSSSKWTMLGADNKPSFQFQVHTDRRGVRVGKRDEQSPERIDILMLGDSFTWGYGVENEETFAFKTIAALGGSGVNLALAGYGTTHSLQTLRRHRDLKPRLVIFPLTEDHLWRNVSPCARSAYPFCFDSSHVAWDRQGQPYIARPWSDGVARVVRHMRAERERLNPLTWVGHGLDVMVAKMRFQAANATALDQEKQSAAFEFLIEQMALATHEMKASLLIVNIPNGVATSPPPRPEFLSRATAKLGYSFLDLTPAFMRVAEPARWGLYLPNDGHPNAAGHALIGQELVAFVRGQNLFAR
jgi:hypothetical protein